jgi:hypothetical protein
MAPCIDVRIVMLSLVSVISVVQYFSSLSSYYQDYLSGLNVSRYGSCSRYYKWCMAPRIDVRIVVLSLVTVIPVV